MAKMRINWQLIIALTIAVGVLVLTAYGLRKYNRSHRAETALENGNKAFDNAQWHQAAENLGKYLGVMPNDIEVLMKYAQAQLNRTPVKRDNIAQAINAYRRILRLDPGWKEASKKLINIYLQINTPGEAELIATRQLELNDDPDIRTILAIALIRQRRFNEAVQELNTVINADPSHILAYDVLGRLVEQRPGDFQVTPQHWFAEATGNNPDSALAYLCRAAFYLRQQKPDKAIDDLDKAQTCDLSDVAVRLKLAAELVNAGLLDKAGNHLNIVYKLEPDNIILWNTWAKLALKTGSGPQMRQVAENALKALSANLPFFMPIAAELFIKSGEFAKAAECIAKMRDQQANSATIAFVQGLMDERQGKLRHALKSWQFAMQSGLDSEQMRLKIAEVMVKLGDRQSAIQQLRTFVNHNENSYRANATLARLLLESGKVAEAAEKVRAALQISPDAFDGRLTYTRARMQLLARGQMPDTKRIWESIDKDLKKLNQNLEKTGDKALAVATLTIHAAILRQQFERAERLVAELKKDYPSRIQVALAQVEIMFAKGRTEQAEAELHNIMAKFPKSITVVKYLVGLLARQNKLAQCQNILTQAIERLDQAAGSRELTLMLTEVYARQNLTEKAYELLVSMTKNMPNDIPLKQRLLSYCRMINRTRDSQKLVDEIKAVGGNDAWQWRYEQAMLWFDGENFNNYYPQIVTLLKENLLQSPADQAGRRLLAATYERAGKLQLAILTYREVLNRSPNDIDSIVAVVAAMYRVNKYEQADEILSRAARAKLLDPRLSKLELQSYLRQGKLSAAVDILQNSFDSDPENENICLSLALLKIHLTKYDEAQELLNRLRTRKPDSLSTAAALVELNLRRHRNDQALNLCNEMIQKHDSLTAYMLRSRTNVRLGKITQAGRDMQKAIAKEPGKAETFIVESSFYRSIGQFDKAVEPMKKALAAAPQDFRVKKIAALTFLATSNPQTIRLGRELLDTALAANPQDIDLRLNKARLFLLEATPASIKQATDILRKVTAEQPETEQAWALLSEAYLKQGDTANAVDFILHGLSYSPNSKSLMLLKARAEATRAPALAVPTLETLLTSYPDDLDIVVYLADMYLKTAQHKKAIDLLNARIKLSGDTNMRKLNIALATAYCMDGNNTKAIEMFTSLYQDQPDDIAPLLAHAKVLKDRRMWPELIEKVVTCYKKHPENEKIFRIILEDMVTNSDVAAKKAAEDILRAIIEIDSNCADALNALAVLLHTTGRPDTAAGFYEKVLVIEPQRLVAINNLAWILCEHQGNYQKALLLAERGLVIEPDYVDLIDTRGVILYRLKDYEKAVVDFQRAISLYSQQTQAIVGVYFHLARALARLDRKTEAVKNLKKAQELNMQVGGLSSNEATEASQLLAELSKESDYVPLKK